MNNEKSNQSQYFPIFYPSSKHTNKSESDITKPEFSVKRRKMKISSDQMLLDAGQKRFGLTECSQCKYVYNAGDPNDEAMHNNHHNATNVLQFPGWKNEHLVETFSNGSRIIQVMPTDSKVWIDKVKRVIEVINRDMGYFDMTFDIGASKVFLFILNKNIIGCLVAERKTRGFKVLNSQEEIDLCSTEEFAVECGVSRIWVAPQFRKKRVATKLMDALKSHFMLGQLLKNCDIALSSPTTEGKLFAAKYFQTNNFFTYFD
ncbi:hypothetical protein WA026_004960 [Henosepilachna vigintioctopunctata]|uniref:N-acetyltransferase ESCO2 n=1 Tax=Henosepilachna vigintioctopunctata TaxID=420089 RepID=A0AAW1UW07_9CUCU